MVSNPPRGGRRRLLSRDVHSIAYTHAADGKPYRHEFGGAVNLALLDDGSIHIWHRSKRLWEDM